MILTHCNGTLCTLLNDDLYSRTACAWRRYLKVLNTSVAKASLQELPRYRTAKRVTVGTAAAAQSILGDDHAWAMLLEPPGWHALQVGEAGSEFSGLRV
jgi:hypothetical protein